MSQPVLPTVHTARLLWLESPFWYAMAGLLMPKTVHWPEIQTIQSIKVLLGYIFSEETWFHFFIVSHFPFFLSHRAFRHKGDPLLHCFEQERNGQIRTYLSLVSPYL